MKKLLLSIYLLFSVLYYSSGQNVTVTSSFDSSRIYIGDQIKYTITVDQPSGLKLDLPAFKDTICKNIEIISGPKTDSSKSQGRVRIIQKYLVTSFDSGRYQVPPVFAETKGEGGVKRFYSDYSVLEVSRVRTAPADTAAKIFDIIKPYKAPVTFNEILPWILALIIAAALIWALITYLPKLKKEKVEEVFVPKDPAHIIAFRELENLQKEELWQKGEIKAYYTRLTEILRQYLEDRFNVFSMELTSEETLDMLVKTGFKKDTSYNNLKSVLMGADLVKFAKYNPLPDEHITHFQNSWNFVEVTKLVETVNEPVEGQNIEKEEKA